MAVDSDKNLTHNPDSIIFCSLLYDPQIGKSAYYPRSDPYDQIYWMSLSCIYAVRVKMKPYAVDESCEPV